MDAALLYLIEILHQTTTAFGTRTCLLCCILSKFYIKPQPRGAHLGALRGCILSKFYIKPQPLLRLLSCSIVVSYRNSTSNHNLPSLTFPLLLVVSYRNSTSNHNVSFDVYLAIEVVSYRNSTSNHNVWLAKATHKRLYLIEILHQTTTIRKQGMILDCCILSKFYIKPQHSPRLIVMLPRCILSKFYIKPQRRPQQPSCCSGCILSKFYIKPQLARQWLMVPCVVSYRNSTSNHNSSVRLVFRTLVVSYRNSTSNHNYVNPLSWQYLVVSYRNSTSNHNLDVGHKFRVVVVSYRNSTSNHNASIPPYPVDRVVSYRNSTSNHNLADAYVTTKQLYLIEILHQTTTKSDEVEWYKGCILSKFYIKPQRRASY